MAPIIRHPCQFFRTAEAQTKMAPIAIRLIYSVASLPSMPEKYQRQGLSLDPVNPSFSTPKTRRTFTANKVVETTAIGDFTPSGSPRILSLYRLLRSYSLNRRRRSCSSFT